MICTECGKEMYINYEKCGAFYTCTCEAKAEAPEEKQKICPVCGQYLVKKWNKSAKKYFFACTNYYNHEEK